MARTPRPGSRQRPAVCALIVAAVIGTAGCATAPGSDASSSPAAAVSVPGPQSLAETGSTLLYPLFKEWANGYQNQFPGVTITTAGTGSSSAAYLSKVDFQPLPPQVAAIAVALIAKIG